MTLADMSLSEIRERIRAMTEAFCCYHEPTEPIIINDIPGIGLDAVKVDGMSVDEWIAKQFQAGGFIDELPF